MKKIPPIPHKSLDTTKKTPYNTPTLRRWVEQLAARRAHNPEAVGSSPTPAIQKALEEFQVLFTFKLVPYTPLPQIKTPVPQTAPA